MWCSSRGEMRRVRVGTPDGARLAKKTQKTRQIIQPKYNQTFTIKLPPKGTTNIQPKIQQLALETLQWAVYTAPTGGNKCFAAVFSCTCGMLGTEKEQTMPANANPPFCTG